MHSLLSAGNYQAGRKFFLRWVKEYLKKQDVKYPAVNAFCKQRRLYFTHPRIYRITYNLLFKLRDVIQHKTKRK
jgi:hypothetical protein